MEKRVEEAMPRQARKRKMPKDQNPRLQAKKKRYSAPTLPQRYPCRHNSKAFQCANVSMRDIKLFYSKFYEHPEKPYQDDYIIKNCTVSNPQRKRRLNGRGHAKNMSIIYTIKKEDGQIVPVCRNMFLRSLLIKKGRVRGVLSRYKDSGCMAIEKRGGDKKSEKYHGVRDAVIAFIKKFNGTESHYCRSKSIRTYLPSELSIAKMHKLFLGENPEHATCKESYFRKIFNTKFNLSFSHPRSDMCSTCLQLKEKIKIEKDDTKSAYMKTELNIHNLRANAFFEFLKENDPQIKILSFDCQKNQALPKVPDQATYYSRQLYIYNFTIVVGDSHSELTKENVFTYTWTENSFNKGSNELASALFHCLMNNVKFEGVKIVRLMADGCAGQNKNSTMLGMLSKWLSSHAPTNVKRVEMIFPVTGHSFIPPDRVFGVLEKEIKTNNVIVQTEEYIKMYEKHSTVFRLDSDLAVYDWKTALQEVQKTTQALHFKIMQCKRFVLSRMKAEKRGVIVRGEPNYHNDVSLRRNITKPGKFASDVMPLPITAGVPVKNAKIKDVISLLEKHYGKEWSVREELKYYKDVVESNVNAANNDTNEDDLILDHECEYVFEENVNNLV